MQDEHQEQQKEQCIDSMPAEAKLAAFDQGGAIHRQVGAAPSHDEIDSEHNSVLMDGQVVGTIKITSGEVTIMRDGQSIEAGKGMDVLVGDKLQTGPNSAVGVVMNDNSRFSLGPDSDRAIKAPQCTLGKDPGEFNLRLTEVKPMDGEVAKLRTPLAMTLLMPTTVLGRK